MTVRLTIEGSTLCGIFEGAGSELQEQLIFEMATILRAQGYVVEIAHKWETPGEIATRLGVTVKTVWQRMKHPRCPKPHDVIRNGKGIEVLRSHSMLDKFLTSGPSRLQKADKFKPGEANAVLLHGDDSSKALTPISGVCSQKRA